MAHVLLLFTLTALPFWVMAGTTDGFFGEYSNEIANRVGRTGVPYMQPYALRHRANSFLPALSFATILEDKGSQDLTSHMHYAGTMFTLQSDLGRDYFLLGTVRKQRCTDAPSTGRWCNVRRP
jgi:hypothetical protein